MFTITISVRALTVFSYSNVTMLQELDFYNIDKVHITHCSMGTLLSVLVYSQVFE